ncbi:MAG TPA: FAD-dependent oxidoreductase [Candidatus Polarisedimenticolia bacterium]|nr:FAD-dependent oxidoreductase [Candidatus Polarisedimenticolia bacterium]
MAGSRSKGVRRRAATTRRPAARRTTRALARGRGASKPFDVAVVGAGVFGSWIAWTLRRAGKSVALLDAHGPGHARASSGGQTRVIRIGYGEQEIYSRWSLRSLGLWKTLAKRPGCGDLFQKSGVLWLARGDNPLVTKTLATLKHLKVRHEVLDATAIGRRWPQFDLGPISWGLYEPESGFLLAYEGVQAVARAAIDDGVTFIGEAAMPILSAAGPVASLPTRSGGAVEAGRYVFACGPWLPRLFPDLLGRRIFTTRQEVFYLGPPPGDTRFQPVSIPVWLDFGEEIYGLPDYKGRGFKLAVDRHGPPADPESMERVVTPEITARVREYAGRRFPALSSAPIIGSEVCQYENTSNGDFLIDRHPAHDNVWLVGGGSGHGFKHGPAIGEYVAERLLKGGDVDPRFSLATKAEVQHRAIY